MIMNKNQTFSTVIYLLLISQIAHAQQSFHYAKAGRDWKAGECASGWRQSPIDIVIRDTVPIKENHGDDLDIKLDYNDFEGDDFDMEFDGHHYKIIRSSKESAGEMTARVSSDRKDHTFELMEIVFHGGSEHTIDGKRYDLEMQILHKQKGEKLERPFAILSILFHAGDANIFLDKIMEEEEVAWEEMLDEEILEYYHYEGSFTTPECKQLVNWYIWNEIQEASQEQID